MDTKLIYILLLIIIILSSVLIIKINSTPKYDEEIYKQVYKEYEQIISMQEETNNVEEIKEENKNSKNEIYQNASGVTYKVCATIAIPKIRYYAPIISETSEEYLKIAPTKLFGPEPNETGNFCIAGHNYKDDRFFSDLYKLEMGDTIQLSDRQNNKLTYKVYNKFEVYEDDLSVTNQNTDGKIELTLITCTNNPRKRLVVKCASI